MTRESDSPPPGLTRRSVIAAGVGVAVMPAWSAAPGALPAPRVGSAATYLYFSAAEAAFVDAAVSHLIPADELGAGAVQAGVTVFIDSQLAGPYGGAVDWYMQGPFAEGTKQQGFQSPLAPAALYRAAIGAIERRVHGDEGHTFADLSAAQRDDWLHQLEDGKPDLGDVPAKTFFDLLWQNTQEGYFADPLYGGNRGFAGWKLIGYPGPRYNYLGVINRYGERYPLPVVGLKGRQA